MDKIEMYLYLRRALLEAKIAHVNNPAAVASRRSGQRSKKEGCSMIITLWPGRSARGQEFIETICGQDL